MKFTIYFLKWLGADIKQYWATARQRSKRALLQLGQVIRYFLQIGSCMAVAGCGLVLLLKVTTDAVFIVEHYHYHTLVELIIVALVINGVFYISDKLVEYREEQERLLQMLKD